MVDVEGRGSCLTWKSRFVADVEGRGSWLTWKVEVRG